MEIQGSVFVLGDHVNTDEIIAARYLSSDDRQVLGRYCLEDIRPGFGRQPQTVGAILLAGHNFGCGSSREHAPMAILGCGIRAVLARSFARIFLRNAINIGLPILEIPLWEGIGEGDRVDINLASGRVHIPEKHLVFQAQAYPPFLQEVMDRGGWLPYLRHRSGQDDLYRKKEKEND